MALHWDEHNTAADGTHAFRVFKELHPSRPNQPWVLSIQDLREGVVVFLQPYHTEADAKRGAKDWKKNPDAK